jgi:putative flippase GtrA
MRCINWGQRAKSFLATPDVHLFIKQSVKFILVGVLNTLVGWGTFLIALWLFKLEFQTANIISYACGLTNSFCFNKFWTFKSKKFRNREIASFLFVFAAGFCAQFWLSVFLEDDRNWPPLLAFLAGNIVYTIIGFVGNKVLTFKTRTEEMT